jgi:hypothetical protein
MIPMMVPIFSAVTSRKFGGSASGGGGGLGAGVSIIVPL